MAGVTASRPIWTNMRAKSSTKTEQIIMSAAIRNGYMRGYQEVCELCGFCYKTFWNYRKNDSFPISWIRSMDKHLGFTDEELLTIIRGK